MYHYPKQYRVEYDGSFNLKKAPSSPPEDIPNKKELKNQLAELTKEMAKLQEVLYADNRYAILLVFQAMDAAGKDGTIRAVTSGVNPAGFQVSSFKQPSANELEHDFLWRTTRQLPERGRIGVFNRSYYEEVLVVRVHPEYLQSQNLPKVPDNLTTFWEQRLTSIQQHEEHLARNGTVIIKFWLNVSRDEQKQRFLARLDEPEKNWKFSTSDLKGRQHWDAYMQAYEQTLKATSKDYAPWYAIPADNKPYMRVIVAETIVKTLKALPLRYPEVSASDQQHFAEARQQLAAED